MKIKKFTTALIAFLCLTNLSFASSYNLHTDASVKSQTSTVINTDNQDEHIRFYTNKDGKWAKYANSTTGELGWVDLDEIEQQKANTLRKNLLKYIDEQVSYHNDKLSSLGKLKVKINQANYQELQKYYHYSGHGRNIVKFVNSSLGKNGKVYEQSSKYFF